VKTSRETVKVRFSVALGVLSFGGLSIVMAMALLGSAASVKFLLVWPALMLGGCLVGCVLDARK
jgi:hypothetical protein